MPSADVLPWHPEDDDPGPAHRNRECRVKRIQINTSNLTSDLYPDVDDDVYEDPIFAPDAIEVPDYDSPTRVNLLDVGTMHDYWDRDEDVITDVRRTL